MAGVAASAVLTAIIGGIQAHESHQVNKKQLARQKESDRLAYEVAKKESDANIKNINSQSEEDERRKRRLLKSQMATQKARMAAAGVSGHGGSADALFSGMTNNINQEIETSKALDVSRINSIKRNLALSKQKSLLSYENQKDSNGLSTFNNVSGIATGFGNEVLGDKTLGDIF
ncbi:MAG: hypothetical protein GY804_03470 [Alphaproteobacteria bacterium]|nr:hypothetical protein [Alphaproteobacteria bacterium]